MNQPGWTDDPIFEKNKNEVLRMFIGTLILILFIVILCAVLAYIGRALSVHAEESFSGCPIGQVYRQYKCPSNPWESCDPYILHAQADEDFCEMIVYRNDWSEPYIRTVPSTLCYPDPPWDGRVCMTFYPDLIGVWTEGKTYGIHSVYVNSVRRYPVWLPIVGR